MKSASLASRLIATGLTAFPVSVAFAQTETTTDPVGLIEMSVAGGSVSSPQLSLISPTLTRPISWQGTVASVAGTVITVSGTPWTAGQFNGANGSHYVEVISATDSTKTGAVTDITATTASTITTSDNLTSPTVFLAAGDTIKIRKHVTIADVFGATNSANLQGSDDASTADEILIYSGATPSVYWYYDGSGGGSAGWKDLGFASAANIPIGPNDGVVVRRKGTGSRTITVAGAVKTGNTLVAIQTGLNVLGTTSAQGVTLGSSGLVNGVLGFKGSDDASTGDELLLYTGAVPATYWYYDGSAGGSAGWKDLGFGNANSVAIAPGSTFVIRRKNGTAFNWPLPAPTSF